MRVLVLGAGVLGSLYAARLQDSGHDVTVLARGRRLADLRERGIVLVESSTGRQTITPVAVVDRLEADVVYDWVVVLVRKNQLEEVLPILEANRTTPNILLMVNNASGVEAIADRLGRDRVVLAFPGAGGVREGAVVRYEIVSGLIQPTTLGELDGAITPRLLAMAEVLRMAGFPVETSNAMDAWLKTHVAVVSPVANAIYLAGGDNYRLSRTRDGVVLMARAIKEGFRVLQALKIPITPFKYRLLPLIPEPILVAALQRALATEWATTVITRHANAGRDEMQLLADEFQVLVEMAGVETPALNELYGYIDPARGTVPEGRAQLKLDWRSFWGSVAVLGLMAALILWLRGRKGMNS